jgi:hypothetical protein
MSEEIINRVANSGLVTIDLDDYYVSGERVFFDFKPLLFHELILKEKDFREFVNEHDWNQYHNKHVAIGCSVDVIIPSWAYMVIASKLTNIVQTQVQGNLEFLEAYLMHETLKKINPLDYQEAKVVIKGCGKYPTPANAFVEITALLSPYVSSMMYGEPCSTVPVYKKRKK